MSLEPISDGELRAALAPCRVDPASFEAEVRARLVIAERDQVNTPRLSRSPLFNAVAALLPLQLMTGCQTPDAAAKVAPIPLFYKLLSYLAFPALSLIALVVAAILSVQRIRGLESTYRSAPGQGSLNPQELRQWIRVHTPAWYAATSVILLVFMIGATWLVFLVYVGSFACLVLALSSLAKSGLGSRLTVSRVCAMGLMFLGQASGIRVGNNEIHFVDQYAVAMIFYAGFIGLIAVYLWCASSSVPLESSDWRENIYVRSLIGGVAFAALVFLMVKNGSPILSPCTPLRIKHYVESSPPVGHTSARFISWREWEIPARWTVDAQLHPDLSAAKRVLAEELEGEAHSSVLGSAFRMGLVRRDQIDLIHGPYQSYQDRITSIFSGLNLPMKSQSITFLEHYDWAIRAAVLKGDLTPERQAFLAARLHVNLDDLATKQHVQLEEALRATQLLELLQGPIERDRYRDTIHSLLRRFHCVGGGGFQFAGGFRTYANLSTGSFDATSHAVQLMEIYGIPAGIDLNWIRSYLKPSWRNRSEQWVAGATLLRLNNLPGATQPTYFQILYYERNILAALILVGLCCYATLLSPPPLQPSSNPDVPEVR
ncbi:MAG: hypothetical protein JWN70_3456 [Planctomycetaceae bacterium]|nr:hypothetical protein [Planctomycetaceae bacterium]